MRAGSSRICPKERTHANQRRILPHCGVPRCGVEATPPMGSAKALHTTRYRAFLSRLRQARVEAGLTQEEVAARLGRPQTWVSKCELGERRVDFVEIEDFAAACEKPLEFFRTRTKGRGRR